MMRALLPLAGLALGCQALSGVDDLEVVADAGTSSSGGSSASGGGAGSGAVGGSSGTAGSGGNAGGGGSPQPCGAGATCLPAPEAGWLGPVVASTGPVTGEIPACAGAGLTADKTLYAPATQWPDATCSPCDCSTPDVSTIACTATVPGGSSSSCNGPSLQVGTTCFDATKVSGVTFVGEPTSFTATHTSTCSPSGGIATKGDAQAGTVFVSCSVSGTCSGSDVCVPSPSGGFTSICIYRAGDWACPPEYPSLAKFNELSDERACTACQCSSPSGAVCSGEVFKYATVASPDCSNVSQKLTSCSSVAPGLQLGNVTIVDPGSCTPSGGTHTGSVELVQDYSVCCK